MKKPSKSRKSLARKRKLARRVRAREYKSKVELEQALERCRNVSRDILARMTRSVWWGTATALQFAAMKHRHTHAPTD